MCHKRRLADDIRRSNDHGAKIDYLTIANEVLKEAGYKKPFRIQQQISKQSYDINQAVVQEELRANDQGIVYGYATNETVAL